jgi:glycosyltransferase involved in cell wall biosynthesis
MKTRKALLLSCFLLRGYGVSVVADELQKRLRSFGWDLHIGYLETDEHSLGLNRIFMPADAVEISAYCARNRIDIVLAQTSPYFEVLPQLTGVAATVCYEHGDPTPDFLVHESAKRVAIKRIKRDSVYPLVTDVWTISHFLRHDIEWLRARVIPNGADHIGAVPERRITKPEEPARVGFLARLGDLEAQYKGNRTLIELAGRFRHDANVEFRVLGRGSEADAEPFRLAGIDVILNASDDERKRFLEEIDIFFSPSRWEGFNLPLVEAQHAGCASMAFDVGAHPETTPYVMRNLDDVEALLRHWLNDRQALFEAGERCRRFVDTKFTWDASAAQVAKLLDEVVTTSSRGPVILRRIRLVLRREGLVGTARKVLRKVRLSQ